MSSTIIGSILPLITDLLQKSLYICKDVYKESNKNRVCRKKINTISLSYQSYISYGRRYTDITDEMTAILFYIGVNLNDFKRLYNLKLDSTILKLDQESDRFKPLALYKIDQWNKIIIYKEDKRVLYARCYDENTEENDHNGENPNGMKKSINTKRYIIELSSYDFSLDEINQFIQKCKQQHKDHLK